MLSPGRIIKHALAATLPGRVLIRQPAVRHNIALTFDDGPDPRNTPRILDALEAGGARATFFVQGKPAQEHPSLVREMQARGHQIGNHGYSHLDARRCGLREYVEDIHRAQHVLQDILGERIEKIFRPPYGNITGLSFLALARRGFRFIFWSQDSRDSFIRETAALTAHVDSLPIAGGDVLLLHEDYAHTVESLPHILHSVKSRGFGLCRISDLVKGREI